MDFLKCYVKNSSNPSKDSIGEAISEKLSTDNSSISESLQSQKKAITKNVCPHCGYVAPFCYYNLTKECSNVPRRSLKGAYETKKTGS